MDEHDEHDDYVYRLGKKEGWTEVYEALKAAGSEYWEAADYVKRNFLG